MNYLIIGIILILALFAIRLSNKHGIPALLLFIVLGMVFGAIGFEFNDFEFADSFATVALMVIMFYGGFGTNWKMAKPVAKEAIVLSSLGVVATALITGLFCHYVLNFGLIEGMLIGSIVGSTDYASVSNILRSKNLNLKYNTASLLELESGSNDPTAYTMTMVFLSVLMGSAVSIPVLILSQVALGLLMGFVFAYVSGKLFNKLLFGADGLYAVFMAAIMLITYASTDIVGGNGYLALYILGIYLGNMEFRGKRDIVFFYDGFTEIMQIGLFFILGLLSNLTDFLKAFPIALAIMLFMTIIARPLTVYGLMLPFRPKRNQLNMISLAGIRGAAAIAFAIMAVNSYEFFTVDIYHIVFGICVLSSLVQGSLMPVGAKKWDMLDPNDTVLKTFNYYQNKAEIGFLETRIHPNSYLIGSKVKDLNLTFDFIVAKIERNGKTIVPRGHITIEENDLVVLGGEKHFDLSGHDLIEFTIPKGHQWIGKYIKDLELPPDRLIIIVQRKDSEIVVPIGDTLITEGDQVIMIKVEHSLEFPREEVEKSAEIKEPTETMETKESIEPKESN
ncbi:MAG: potassium/proton antiporter [Tissierellia bacterium]|nr:potassium/proton antiporter [Tissierellia bacterium]